MVRERHAALYADMASKIANYGHMILGVLSDEETKTPGFSYSVGLTPKHGFELIVFGLPYKHAQVILNYIVKNLKVGATIQLDVPDDRWCNMPVMFKKCNQLVMDWGTKAYEYYNTDHLTFYQIVLPDRAGRFPGDAGFDELYMKTRQKLLY